MDAIASRFRLAIRGETTQQQDAIAAVADHGRGASGGLQ
jgi:hypothetical protein